MKSKNLLWAGFIVISLFTFFRVVYGPIVFSPNTYMFQDRGDGIRNYFVVADHVKNDSVFWHNGGLNYPYGDHTLTADAMPLFSNTVKAISFCFPAVKDWTVGLQNLLVITSYPIACIFLFLIFRKLGMPGFHAAAGGIAIVLLGPQAWRIPWMPGLSIAWYYPVAIYLFLCYFQSAKRLKWSMAIGIYVLSVFFMHAYVGVALSLAFFMLVWTVHLKELLKTRRFGTFLKDLLIQSVGPAFLFVVFMIISDHHPPRINTPHGFFEMTSTIKTIFSRAGDHPFSWFHSLFINSEKFVIDSHWEGWSYIGFLATVMLLYAVFRMVRRFTNHNSLRATGKNGLHLLWPAAVVLLLLSMGLPFICHPVFEMVSEYMPFVRQVRSLGRFAWFFYHVAGVYAIYALYLIFKSLCFRANRHIAYAVFLTGIAIPVIEGVDMHLEISKDNPVKLNVFNRKILDQHPAFSFLSDGINAIDGKPFQGIVPMPYFHFGSDLFAPPLDYTRDHLSSAFIFAYHSGIPLTGCYSTRVPVRESLASMQFFAPSWIEKQIKNDFPDHRPLLAFRPTGETIHAREAVFFKKGIPVFENQKLKLKELAWDSLWTDGSFIIEDNFYQNKSSFSYNLNDEWFSADPEPLVHYESFDHIKSAFTFNGSGAIEAPHREVVLLLSTDKIGMPGPVTVSFWIQGAENRLQADLFLGKSEDGKIRYIRSLNHAKRTYDIVNNWMRWTFDLDPSEAEAATGVYLGGRHFRQKKYIDELWVQKKGSSVFRTMTTEKGIVLWWNNFPVKAITTK